MMGVTLCRLWQNGLNLWRLRRRISRRCSLESLGRKQAARKQMIWRNRCNLNDLYMLCIVFKPCIQSNLLYTLDIYFFTPKNFLGSRLFSRYLHRRYHPPTDIISPLYCLQQPPLTSVSLSLRPSSLHPSHLSECFGKQKMPCPN